MRNLNFFFLVCLALINIFLLHLINKNQNIVNDFAHQHVLDSTYILKYQQIVKILNNRDEISKAIKSNCELFSALTQNDNVKIILHYSEGGCNSCVREIALDLLSVADYLGIDNIILTGSFNSNDHFYKISGNIDQSFLHIPFKEFQTICSIQEPIIIIVDNSLTIISLFLPNMLEDSKRYTFFNEILPDMVHKNLIYNRLL